MKSKSGYSLVGFLTAIAIIFIIGLIFQATVNAGTVTEPTVFRDRVSFRGSTAPDFDADNKFSIGGTAVTKTAAELNTVNAGASITGNIPVAAITNALNQAVYTTNTLTGDGVTNVFIWATVGQVKVLKSITTTP